jgi:hypothetical protein
MSDPVSRNTTLAFPFETFVTTDCERTPALHRDFGLRLTKRIYEQGDCGGRLFARTRDHGITGTVPRGRVTGGGKCRDTRYLTPRITNDARVLMRARVRRGHERLLDVPRT